MTAEQKQAESTDIAPILKDWFPHDRVVFFSDAVFAIAITILVIEIKVPEREQVLSQGLASALVTIAPVFLAFLITFFVIATFWAAHLRTFRETDTVDIKLFWLNFLELMFIVLMPFTAGLYSEASVSGSLGFLQPAFTLYCLNMAGVALMSFACRNHVIRIAQLSRKYGPHEISWMRTRSLIPLFGFLACIPLGYVFPGWGGFGLFLIFPAMSIARRYYQTKKQVSVSK